jgi:hypothetical protein
MRKTLEQSILLTIWVLVTALELFLLWRSLIISPDQWSILRSPFLPIAGIFYWNCLTLSIWKAIDLTYDKQTAHIKEN